MHILFLDQFRVPGGAQQCLRDLLPAVAARGWTFTLVDNLEIGPFQHGRKSLGDVVKFARQIPAARRAIAAMRGDLLYVNGPRLLPAIPAGRPVVFHCHNYLAQGYAAWLARRAIRRTRATVIGACRFVLEPLRAPDAAVVYNGVAESQPRRPDESFRIGMIGRIASQKGQLEFLRAARHLHDCRLVICGAPLFGDAAYAAEVKKMAEGMPVEFLGWQDNAGAVLARLDLLVVPSTVPEAAPRVILEAFSAGVPVLASAGGGIPELIEHGRTGFLIESLAEQMPALKSSPELLRTVARNAREEWRRRFTLEQYRRGIMRILERAA